MNNLDILYVSDTDLLKQCLKIRNDVFTIEKKVPESIEVDEYDCLNGKCDHFLIRFEGENVGTIRCMHTSDDEVKIQRFLLKQVLSV